MATDSERLQDLIIHNGGVTDFRCYVSMFHLKGASHHVIAPPNSHIECQITQERYKLRHGYKIGLMPVADAHKSLACDMHIEDFLYLIDWGQIFIKSSPNVKENIKDCCNSIVDAAASTVGKAIVAFQKIFYKF